jgi:hypothetical protein
MARGGRGGGNRNPANQPRDVQVSRKISWLLRHGADQEGLKLGKGGYVNVQEAVSLIPNLYLERFGTSPKRQLDHAEVLMHAHVDIELKFTTCDRLTPLSSTPKLSKA